ncbi:MAG: site-2 protease family protein, partial [Endomicrobiales bacterium]
MGLLPLLINNPVLFFMLAVMLLYSVIAHEIAHGLVAYVFGDDTAYISGRLTLNPMSHLDPIGTLMLFIAGFGWAKPVPVNYFRLMHTKFGFISVALAGCVMNILIATVCLFFMQFDIVKHNPTLMNLLPLLAKINIVLGSFNLIPIPPLDGSRVLMSVLPVEARNALAAFEPFGFFMIILLLFTG